MADGQTADVLMLQTKAREVLGGEECPNANTNHIAIMLVLLVYGTNGEDMRPSLSTLAAEASMSLTAVKKVMRELEAWGAINVAEKEERKPVVWRLGPLMQGEVAASHHLALQAKQRVLRAKAKEKPPPDPLKQMARAIKTVQKHKPEALVQRNDETQTEILMMPYGIGQDMQEILDGERTEFPVYELPEVTVKSRKYASFRSQDTRTVDPDDDNA